MEGSERLQDILDCFSGADGGVGYVLMCDLVAALEKQAQEGDPAARLVLEQVDRFARLVRKVAKPRPYKP